MNLDQAKALDRKGWHKIADKLKPETRNFIDEEVGTLNAAAVKLGLSFVIVK